MAVKRDPESGETLGHKPASPTRLLIARAFTIVEDVVYIVLGVLLAGTALALLATGAAGFGRSVLAGAPPQAFVSVLDQILLVLLVIELLYTVKVSFREHSLVPEPFLIVGLIAVTRRILIITAELSALLEKGDASPVPPGDAGARSADGHGRRVRGLPLDAPQTQRDPHPGPLKRPPSLTNRANRLDATPSQPLASRIVSRPKGGGGPRCGSPQRSRSSATREGRRTREGDDGGECRTAGG